MLSADGCGKHACFNQMLVHEADNAASNTYSRPRATSAVSPPMPANKRPSSNANAKRP